MQSTHARKRHGIEVLLAIVAIFAVGVSPALASSTSAGVSETFTIAASVTVANVPSTGTFTSPPNCQAVAHVPFCLASDYSYAFTSTVGTNNGTGLTVAVKATTLVAGSSTIPLSARGVLWNVPSGFTTATAADSGHLGQLDPTTPFTLGSTAAQGSVALAIEPLLRLDPNAFPAGSYSGTFTVVATTNP
jgi:hypothetical protein